MAETSRKKWIVAIEVLWFLATILPLVTAIVTVPLMLFMEKKIRNAKRF